jgi:peptidoglycan/xylan/chitin deacetylase (PgdA/CDA1 family)
MGRSDQYRGVPPGPCRKDNCLHMPYRDMTRTLRSAALAVAYWSGFAGSERRQQPVGRIVNFHGTPRSAAAEFERQMRYLRSHFDVVPLAQIAAGVGGSPASLAGRVALTFDDGLRNNVTVAYPILRRLGLPATFFVCPGLIDERRWLWTHDIRQRLHFAGDGARADAFVEWMKSLDLATRKRVEIAVREASRDYVASAAERHAFDLADWNELRALDPALITIGSHSLTHPILSRLTPDEAQEEIVASRRLLEHRLARSVDFFSYPNDAFDTTVHELVRRHYRAACQGFAPWMGSQQDPHLLPRTNVPRGAMRLALALHRVQSRGGEPVARESTLLTLIEP